MAAGKRESEALNGALRWAWIAEGPELRADRAVSHAIEAKLGNWNPEAPPALPSRSQIQKLIAEGALRLNGKTIRSSDKVHAGAELDLMLPAPRPMELTPENRPIEILFEDAHIVVVNKPPGLTVHPSETQAEGTLVHALLHHVRDLSGIGGVLRPGIVHRIDKDTSGALLVTKTDAAHRVMVESFARHDLERRYWALCYGSLELRTGEERRIETLIDRDPKDRKKMSMKVKEGRRAVTYFRELETYQAPAPGRSAPQSFASLIEARLETGRTHQVRVHLSGLEHPLLADPVYGTPSEKHPRWLALPAPVRRLVEAMPGQALHARLLAFKHPITGEALRFEAEPPPAFASLLEGLRSYHARSAV